MILITNLLSYHRFGQQQLLQRPITIQSTNLSHTVADENLVIHASSTWLSPSTTMITTPPSIGDLLKLHNTFMAKQQNFPSLEIANVTSRMPTSLHHIIPAIHRQNVEITFAQAYTPSTKCLGLGHDRPFSDLSFLMCYIDERDYFHLLDMVALHLCKIQLPEWRWYALPTALPPFCQDIKANNLTVQVPNNNLSNYATNLVKELMRPLRISVQHHSHGPRDLATIILSETILSLLPTMSVKDMPYWLLRSYQIISIPRRWPAINNRLNMTTSHQKLTVYSISKFHNRNGSFYHYKTTPTGHEG